MVVYERDGGAGGSSEAMRASFLSSQKLSIRAILNRDKNKIFAVNASLRYWFWILLVTRRFIYFEHTVFDSSNHNKVIRYLYKHLIRLPLFVVTPTRDHLIDIGRLDDGFSFQLNLGNIKKHNRGLNLSDSDTVVRVLFWGRSDYQKNSEFIEGLINDVNSESNIEFEFIILKDVYLDKASFIRLMESCHIYVSTSRHESFNRVLYDATVRGLYTIVSDVPYGNRQFGCECLPLDRHVWIEYFNNFTIGEGCLKEYAQKREKALKSYSNYLLRNTQEIEKFKQCFSQ